ncbi:MAG: hypothetical protein DRI90_00060, partial [Deltaproteobacteria bacterium]
MLVGDLSGTILEGKYRLVRLLGVGGMGSVYEAEHTLISRRVAVKLLLPQLADVPEMAERFLREARSASEIDHPNIIEVYDVGRSDEGHLFIVMELLEGQSLRELLNEQRRLGLGRAIRIILEVLAGLQAAHQQGTIHRDLKPDNVFLVPGDDDSERVKILDFGISKVKDSGAEGGLTRTGAVLGTPHYMAPEQAQGEADVDERIDVWAAGVILYEMLSGSRPYSGDSYNRVIAQILIDPVPRLKEVAPAVPAVLAEVVERALAKERDGRYADVAAMMRALRAVAEELQSLMCGETVITPPEAMDATCPLEMAPTATLVSDHLDGGPRLMGALEPGDPSFAAPVPSPDESTQSDALVNPPLWKRVLWLLLCMPLPLAVLLVAVTMPSALGGIIGIPPGSHLAFSLLIAVAIVFGTSLAAWRIYGFWTRGSWNPWLQGFGFLVFPTAGLLLVFRSHTVLSSQMESALSSFRAYGSISSTQADSILTLLTTALVDHLNAAAMVTVLVAYLALLVLCSQLFVEMVPMALESKAAASFYIDRNPSTLRQGREELHIRLVATHRGPFNRTELLAALAGQGECPEILAAALGADDHGADTSEPSPARCVTAVEARLYCEARGKRLPTPAEWDAALGTITPTSPAVVERTGPLRRGGFGEWTMELLHGTPTFQVKGGEAAQPNVGQLHPGSFS